MTLLKLIRSSGAAITGVAVLIVLSLIAVFAESLAPYGAREQVGVPYARPSGAHPLGLDDLGADVLSQLILGARTSLTVGFAAAFVVLLVGATVGVAAGYHGGALDTVLMRITDYFLVIPTLMLAILASALFGPSLLNLIIIIGLLSWTATARLSRAQTKGLTARSFVRRDKALGASQLHTIFGHVVPHLTPLLLVMGVLAVADAVFAEAALSFLGLGDPGLISWGKMIANAFSGGAISNDAWWVIAPPGLSIVLVVFSCALVSRGLEEALNPRLRVSHLSSEHFTVEPPPDNEAALLMEAVGTRTGAG